MIPTSNTMTDTALSTEADLRGQSESFRNNQMTASLKDARRIDALEQEIKICETSLPDRG